MSFTKLRLTTFGRTLEAKAHQGKGIHFTRVALGDGLLGSASIVNRTTLVSERLSIKIDATMSTDQATQTAVIATLDNRNITEGFPYRELGLFARDPDTGVEGVYLYDNAGQECEFLDTQENGVVIFERLKLLIRLSETDNITFDASGNPLYLTAEDVAALLGRKADLGDDGKILYTQLPELDYDLAGAAEKVQTNLNSHTGDKNNPHGVTKAQVGLGNVPNVTTNNQAPTYTASAALAALKSGETLTLAFGKLARGVSDLIAHLANRSNPHGVTAAQAGAVPLAGGTMTGELKFKRGAWTGSPVTVKDDGDVNGVGLVIQAGGLTVVGGGEAAGNLYNALELSGGTEQLHLASDNTISLHTGCQTIANRKTVTIDTAGKITAPGGFAGAVAGNAASATKLQTARTLDGVGFNGSAAVTHYGSCATAAATAAKAVALTGFALVTGARVAVKFTVTNTAANPTLNVNNTGAKPIYYRGAAIAAGYLAANRTYEFIYNGAQYELVGDLDTNTTYAAAAAAPKAAGTAAVGTSTKYAREDHVHPAQTAVSGNAGTATKLQTARSVRVNLASTTAVNFDGSANITPGVNGILPVANGGTGVNSVSALLNALGLSKAARIATGSYVGTGTYGADHPCSLTFDFVPKLWGGYGQNTTYANTGYVILPNIVSWIPSKVATGANAALYYGRNAAPQHIEYKGKTVSWYVWNGEHGAGEQLNNAAYEYYYFAIY